MRRLPTNRPMPISPALYELGQPDQVSKDGYPIISQQGNFSGCLSRSLVIAGRSHDRLKIAHDKSPSRQACEQT